MNVPVILKLTVAVLKRTLLKFIKRGVGSTLENLTACERNPFPNLSVFECVGPLNEGHVLTVTAVLRRHLIVFNLL